MIVRFLIGFLFKDSYPCSNMIGYFAIGTFVVCYFNRFYYLDYYRDQIKILIISFSFVSLLNLVNLFVLISFFFINLVQEL